MQLPVKSFVKLSLLMVVTKLSNSARRRSLSGRFGFLPEICFVKEVVFFFCLKTVSRQFLLDTPNISGVFVTLAPAIPALTIWPL